jgi:histidinol-phosphate aminotransferase
MLSANEAPETLPDEVLRELKAGLSDFAWRKYPDPLARQLRALIAEANGLEDEQVLLGNGGDELILDLFLAWGGKDRCFLNLPPTFSLYEIYAHTTETRTVALPRDRETFAVAVDATAARLSAGDIDLCIVANPNNPSGNMSAEDELQRLLETSNALICVDEAYFEFSRRTMRPWLDRYPNLAILRTFSKAFSLAGLRLGYILASPEVIATLAKVRMPYSVNAFSQWVGRVAYAHANLFEPRIRAIVEQRDWLYTQLDAIPTVEVWPSEANYLLFRTTNAHRVAQRLLQDYDICIRDFSRAAYLTDCLRVTVGTPAQNEAFLQALRSIV